MTGGFELEPILVCDEPTRVAPLELRPMTPAPEPPSGWRAISKSYRLAPRS